MADLRQTSAKLKLMMNNQVPTILDNVNQVAAICAK